MVKTRMTYQNKLETAETASFYFYLLKREDGIKDCGMGQYLHEDTYLVSCMNSVKTKKISPEILT